MKKFTPIFVAFLLAILAFDAAAQSFSLDIDTSKKSWVMPGILVAPSINANSMSASNITIQWKVLNLTLGAKWKFDAFCDNATCQADTAKGLTNGDTTFTTFPAMSINFKADFIGDSALNNTQSVLSVEMKSGTTTKIGTFIATKTIAGISTSFKSDPIVNIFPNPAQNYIDVVYSPSSDVKTIAIYNLIGKIVNVYKVTNASSAHCEFPADMPSGIYVARIADSKGAVIATRKITRQ